MPASETYIDTVTMRTVAKTTGSFVLTEDGATIVANEIDDLRAKVARVETLSRKFHESVDMTTGEPSIIARAFATEIDKALAGS